MTSDPCIYCGTLVENPLRPGMIVPVCKKHLDEMMVFLPPRERPWRRLTDLEYREAMVVREIEVDHEDEIDGLHDEIKELEKECDILSTDLATVKDSLAAAEAENEELRRIVEQTE